MVAVVYALQKFHQYTFGRHTSDHKPLELIVQKPLVKAPKRLQAMLLRTQKYNFSIEYCKGKEMHIADTLSRAYLCVSDKSDADFDNINTVSFLNISEERAEEIKKATNADLS